jgi:rod shape-determining protein MreB
VEKPGNKVVATGDDALAMIGRVGENVEILQPIVEGRITDLEHSALLIRSFLQQIMKRAIFSSPIMMASVNAGSSMADRLVTTRLLYNLGARGAYTISQPLAASIGAGVPIADSSGCFLLQMGAGTVEAVVVSLGSVVEKQRTEYAGNYLERRLQYVLKNEYRLIIGKTTANELLSKLLTLQNHEKTLAVTGKDLKTNRPTEVLVQNSIIQPEVIRVVTRYEELLKRLLSAVPPELTVDVIDKGLLLSGSLAQIDGLPDFLTLQMGVPVSVVDNPSQAAIDGIGTALEHIELFKQSLAYQYSNQS